MKSGNISIAVIKRLPKYHRYLQELLDKDIIRISSRELSKIIGFSASQIRQDLNNFGGFGQQGYGYNVQELHDEISKILGLTKNYKVVIVGSGNMGQALANYPSFGNIGFDLLSLFDINPKMIGLKINDVLVRDMDDFESFIVENKVDIVYICTNRTGAQEVADMVCKTQVKAIWNFAPVDLNVSNDVVVENVHLIDNLLTISYFIKSNEE